MKSKKMYKTIEQLPNKYRKKINTGRWKVIITKDYVIVGITRKTGKETIYFN